MSKSDNDGSQPLFGTQLLCLHRLHLDSMCSVCTQTLTRGPKHRLAIGRLMSGGQSCCQSMCARAATSLLQTLKSALPLRPPRPRVALVGTCRVRSNVFRTGDQTWRGCRVLGTLKHWSAHTTKDQLCTRVASDVATQQARGTQ